MEKTEQLERAHKFSSNHRHLLENSAVCGCFHCGEMFTSDEITSWIDNDQTALCPVCGIDSILPSNTGKFELCPIFLSKMYERFFCRGTVVRNINGVPVEHYWIRRNKNGEPIEIEESVIPFKD